MEGKLSSQVGHQIEVEVLDILSISTKARCVLGELNRLPMKDIDPLSVPPPGRCKRRDRRAHSLE